MINNWFAKSKKVECNGLDAEINDEILYFEQPTENEENKYHGSAKGVHIVKIEIQDEEMAKATNEARAEEDQGKDEDKTENKVCIFQSFGSKEIEMMH